MKKGKFGIVLCFYPIVAFAAVILQAFWLCALMLVIAAFLEKDEWAARQTLQASVLALIVWFFDNVLRRVVGWVSLPFFSSAVSVIATVLSVIVTLAAIVLSILAIIRVMKEQEANLPLLSDLAYRVYGKKAIKPISYPQAYGQPPVPPVYPQQQPPYNPQQPVQPETPPQNNQP